jgi:uncharacterized protein
VPATTAEPNVTSNPGRSTTAGPTIGVVEIDRNGLEVLAVEECFRLLETATLGRVGVSSGALPTILPVNFCFDDGRIFLRTSAGTKLDAATRNAVVAFEVDDIDRMSHTGWSVVVTGVAEEITDAAEVDALQRLPLRRWAPGGDDRLVAIRPQLVSGRRINPRRATAVA